MVSMPAEAEISNESDASKLTTLYDEHKDLLFGFTLSIIGNRQDSEDVIQNLFQKLWKDRNRWKHVKSWKPWLLRMVRNQAIDHIKQTSRSKKREEIVGKEDFLQPPQEMDSRTSEQVHHVLKQLTEPDRTLMVLKNFQDLTFEEIGEILEISGSTASTRYYKVLEDLKILWEKVEK